MSFVTFVLLLDFSALRDELAPNKDPALFRSRIPKGYQQDASCTPFTVNVRLHWTHSVLGFLLIIYSNYISTPDICI